MLRNQQQCCMSLHDHSSIGITVEIHDFYCLHRQFQTSLRLSHLLCRLCSDLNAAMAVARPATTDSHQNRLLSAHQPLAAARREATLLCPLHRCPTTAANQLQMHGAAASPPPTTGPRNQARFAQLSTAFILCHIAWHTSIA